MDDATQARAHHGRGELTLAESRYVRAIDADPENWGLLHDFAVLLMQTGRSSQAIAYLQRVLRQVPCRTETLLALAFALRASNRLREGLDAIEQVLGSMPNEPTAWLLKGSLEVRMGAAESAEATIRRLLSMESRLPEAWHYLGEALQAQRRWAEAADAYRRALPAQPGEVFNIAMCAEQAGDLLTAREGYVEACKLYPTRTDCLMRLAQIEALLCRFDSESFAVARLESLLSRPTDLAADDIAEAFPLAYLPLSDEARRVVLDRYSARVAARANGFGSCPPGNPSPSDRLKIGYVSADFGGHAVGHLVAGLFAAHDREKVSVYGYSLRKHFDAIAGEIASGLDRLVDCEKMSVDAIASVIRSDGIDVLIDLSGYTDGARPEIFALNPAPMQFGWLGFIHAHHAPWLDGVLLDDYVQPPKSGWPFDDVVIRLSGTMLPARPMRPGEPDRPRFGLPHDSPVLASFNNSYKIDGALVAAWCDILRLAPGARLLVYLPDGAWDGFMEGWRRHRGDESRLHRADRLDTRSHADRLASCDLLLDAFRYQGGASSVESIACGVPVLTREGQSPASRLGVSLNRHLGLDELVCPDTAGYIARAADLANNPGKLVAIRRKMADKVVESGLYDPRRMAQTIEDVCLRHHVGTPFA